MNLIAAGAPTGAVLTYVFPLVFFLGVSLWFYLQRRDDS